MEFYKGFGNSGQLATHHGIVNSNSSGGTSFTTYHHGVNNVNPGFAATQSLSNPYLQKCSSTTNPTSNLTMSQQQ